MKLSVDQLAEGMILSRSIFSQKGELLLKSGVKLKAAKIGALKRHAIKFVEIADPFTLYISPQFTTTKNIEQLYFDFFNRYAPEKMEANTSDLMIEVSRQAKKIAKKILKDEVAINFCIRMRVTDNEFFYRHSIATSALALLICGALGLNEEESSIIGKAALLHDLGLGEMPFLIKPEAPDEPDHALWREHPIYGYHLAREGGINNDICQLILYHHEKWNGSGFPEGLQGEDIPLGSRVISFCEIFDALIRQQKYALYEAIEYFYGAGDYYFDARVVKAFTDNISLYPLGSMVRLSTGEVGIVINVRKNEGPRPVVRLFYNNVNRSYENPETIDLGVERTKFIVEVL